MDRLTEQDFANASKPVVRLTLENLHLRAALAHVKQQNDANESILNDIAEIISAVYSHPRPPTDEERKIAKFFRTTCDEADTA